MPEFSQVNLAAILAIMTVTSLVPFIVISVTSFAKISVVLFIVRNALGVQQTPPNMIMYGITLILTAYIMTPVTSKIYETVTAPGVSFSNINSIEKLISDAAQPVRGFLQRHTHERDRVFFVQATERVWKDSGRAAPEQSDMVVLVPAFLSAELTRAFQIGFLLYLPFLMIDFAISAILIALGMQMMAPNIISTPLKLLLFVLVDGWTRLLEGLILSYA